MECPTGVRSLSLLLLAAAGAASGSVVSVRDPVPDGYASPPSYPAPYGGWADDWTESYAKAVKLVSQMTLAEKTNITAGTGQFMGSTASFRDKMISGSRCVGNTGSALRVGFPQLCLQDGPLGIRATDNNTAFPAGITTGATWNKDLMYERGVAIGQEFRGKGANFYLGPAVGALGRKPRGGRNWEGFGSDPVLQAVAGAETIRGVQEQGVIATIKHLIGNEQEMYRMYNPFQAAYSSNIDDRTMHELYLWPFAEGVHAGVGSVMTSYNDVNGSASSQNSHVINGLLKEELGFQGLVMTDWLSQLSGVGSALSGLDLSMPGDTVANEIPLTGNSHWMYELTRSVLNGSVPVDRLNDMATRVVAAWYQLGQDQGYPEPNFSANTADAVGPLYPGAVVSPSGVVNEFVDVQADHAVVAKQVAQEAITLLKNDDSLLPLTNANSTTLSVFGTDARADPNGINSCTDKSGNRGTLGMGWGSGSANYPYLDDPITSLRRKVPSVTFYETDTFPAKNKIPTPGPDDVAVVFLSSAAGENSYTVENNHGDRDADGLSAWHNGDKLVQDAAAAFSNVVVVVHTVGPLVLEPWIDLPSVKSVLVAHLPGQEAGDSLTEVLLGEASPSGHLPYSIPKSEADYPASVGLVSTPTLSQIQDTYTEGLYVDYRHLNQAGKTPRYAFGHGLSYATFTLSDASVEANNPITSSDLPAPANKPTSPVADLNTTIPSAAEAYEPENFGRIWRYLYSWLSKTDADKARAIADSSDAASYPYPEGYSADQKDTLPPAGGANGGHPALWDVAYTVRVTVTNTDTNTNTNRTFSNSTSSGSEGYAGKAKAVAQAYVQFPDDNAGYDTPVIQLRDFAKTSGLAPGESEVVELALTRKDVSVWDVGRQTWVVPSPDGRYRIWVGLASDDLGVVCYSDSLVCEMGVEGPV